MPMAHTESLAIPLHSFILKCDNGDDSMDADDEGEVLFEAACKCRYGRNSQAKHW